MQPPDATTGCILRSHPNPGPGDAINGLPQTLGKEAGSCTFHTSEKRLNRLNIQHQTLDLLRGEITLSYVATESTRQGSTGASAGGIRTLVLEARKWVAKTLAEEAVLLSVHTSFVWENSFTNA